MTVGAEFVMTADSPVADARTRRFITSALDTGRAVEGSHWRMFECRSPACGCGCRRYAPCSSLNTGVRHDRR